MQQSYLVEIGGNWRKLGGQKRARMRACTMPDWHAALSAMASNCARAAGFWSQGWSWNADGGVWQQMAAILPKPL